MIEEFVKECVKLLTSYPEEIEVEKVKTGENFNEIIKYAKKEDAGKIIGKDGKMIGAIKTLISGCKAKDKIGYKVSVQIKEE